jgi:hypothetical protein
MAVRLADHNLRENLSEAIQAQLKALGVNELQAVVTTDEVGGDGDDEPFDGIYVATDQGIWIGKARVGVDRLTLESSLTPWSDVYGASLVQAGFPYGSGQWLLTVHVKNPSVELHERMAEGRKGPAQEFGEECMRRQRRWSAKPSP